jgi:hypothetical protein
MAVKTKAKPNASPIARAPNSQNAPAQPASATAGAAKKAFPFRLLNAWLKGRRYWSEDDWQTLLASLAAKGYGHFTSRQDGRDALGLYLETHRQTA